MPNNIRRQVTKEETIYLLRLWPLVDNWCSYNSSVELKRLAKASSIAQQVYHESFPDFNTSIVFLICMQVDDIIARFF